MKRYFLSLLFTAVTIISFAQFSKAIIDQKEVKRIETTLSADSMEGRKAFTQGSEKAANFISNEFKEIGLESLKGTKSYKQTFSILSPKAISISASFNGKYIDPKRLIALTCMPDLTITPTSGFRKVYIKQAAELSKQYSDFIKLKENLIVFIDSSMTKTFSRLSARKQFLFKSDKSIVFVLGNFTGDDFVIKSENEITEKRAANVVGVLPGKSRKNELVIFSAHYDHLGIDKATNNDSVYNGANDDASGVAAVISLARYYKAAKNNERTLIFAAFTAEELGGYGSQYFSQQVDPLEVKAMFNIEMIGTESKWGSNSAYITGFEKSDMGEILQKNLQGSNFAFYPDPYPEQDLFYRSDNATLARLGVPAHTISTSKMDNELNYHKLSDEVQTLDLKNMSEIIKSIAISAVSIVTGKDTPTRVKPDLLAR
ncbi:M20/M25/M40 family metallo-hydrolase [Segetibacter koreensis]|uniref:M20/M25/M40 family metallo-hydrolase n=1 Tax=Segetibacter koreensis TaxID=398037 RepID=UPI00037A2ADF|nr:M20/M25/M40 family metallo-hydrolase [Segetibacter koreensis]